MWSGIYQSPYSRPLLNLFYSNHWPRTWALVSLSNASYSGAARICQRGGGGGGGKVRERSDRTEGECGRWVPLFLLQNSCMKTAFSCTCITCHYWGGGGVRLCEVSYIYQSLTTLFMPPIRKGAGGIMFSGCPSVRTGISLTQNLKNPWVDFYHTWPRGAPWWVDELIRFMARSTQGQRSMNFF